MKSITASQDRVPVLQKVAYGFGGLTNNLLSGVFGAMAIVLNLGLRMDPAMIGFIMGFSRLADAFLDPAMGYLSDNTRSRWGRRKPYIVTGAIVTGLIFALLWQIPEGYTQQFYFWFFLIGTTLFYAAFTVYATPFIALGYEMTAGYNERTRIQAYNNLFGQIPWLLLSWCYAFMENKRFFSTNVEGAKALAIIVGISAIITGILPGFFCKEPLYKNASVDEIKKNDAQSLFQKTWDHLKNFFRGFGITLKNRRFLMLAAATFLVFNGFTMIAGLGPYVIIFYVFGGDKTLGATYVGLYGTTLSACTFGAIYVVTWLSTRVGKKRAFLISTTIAILGYVVKWFCYRPNEPYLLLLSAPLVAFGLGGLFTTVSSMIADVCDQDELEVGKRREGTFGAIYWWMVKLGMAVALAVSGVLLNATGFQVDVGQDQTSRTLLLMRIFEIGLPLIAYALALLALSTYDLDEEKLKKIRSELEKRRGKATA